MGGDFHTAAWMENLHQLTIHTHVSSIRLHTAAAGCHRTRGEEVSGERVTGISDEGLITFLGIIHKLDLLTVLQVGSWLL